MRPRPSPRAVVQRDVRKVENASSASFREEIAVEEPLEIQLAWGEVAERTASITMRTPGDDFELAAGFLFAEGIVRHRDEIGDIGYCGPGSTPDHEKNTVRVTLKNAPVAGLNRLDRHFFTTSACGVCGKTSIEALELGTKPAIPELSSPISSSLLGSLPERMREAQPLFSRTGGLHAAALFTSGGTLLDLREDVGRHNAVDKVVGGALLRARVPLADTILVVSGRASFELVQKAVVAGIPVMASVGAPSSLAVDLARQYGIALAGFVRDSKLNVYSGEERILAGD